MQQQKNPTENNDGNSQMWERLQSRVWPHIKKLTLSLPGTKLTDRE